MEPRQPLTLRSLLWLPIGYLLNMTPLVAVTLMVLVVSICGTLYYSLNSDFFGLAAPPFAEITFSKDFTNVTMPDGRAWKIIFEKNTASKFTGVVRAVVHWREEPIPFATHDVLVTNGDYASPRLVSTRVHNHAVYYQWFDDSMPQGTINLLHIVPLNEEIYRQLLKIHEWNLVVIKGLEILRIEIYDKQGKFDSYFQDEGCNSILVTSVEIKAEGTPIP
jgi:hypothetical protein